MSEPIKVSELFAYPEEPVKLISKPENQAAVQEIEMKARSNDEAFEMLIDAGILEYKHYYTLGRWFWDKPKAEIKEIIRKRMP